MAGEKIMIVDDNRLFLEELKQTLFLCGYTVETVPEAINALKVAKKTRPDVILLDLKMKGPNGFQVARQLKAAKETCDIPIIAMSGYFPVEAGPEILNGAKARIKKPFSIQDIIKTIESVLDFKSIEVFN